MPEIDPFAQTWDAVELPKSYIVDRDKGRQFSRTFDLLERLLGVDRAQGEHAWARKLMPEERLFVTRSLDDTLYFAKGHPRSGHPRYTWIDAPGGVRFGRLVPDAAQT